MTRSTAYQILTRHITNKILLQHSLAAEATMRALAARMGEDADEWGITGLLHDADYEKSKGHPEKHGQLLLKLEPNSIPSQIEHAIQAHNYEETHVMPSSKMEWALVCCDDLTGIIQELAEKQKNKSAASISLEIVLHALEKKKSQKMLYKHITLCEEKLEIPLEEFVAITLSAMQGIATMLADTKTLDKE